MIRLLAATLLIASFGVVADVTLTPLSNNTPADADKVMGNFNALKQGVEANTTAIEGLTGSGQLCATGFSCISGTFYYRHGSDAEAEWWGRPNANPNCGFGATDFFLYVLNSKWVVGTGLGGSSGVIATCDTDSFVEHPTQCGSNWVDANGPIEASFSSKACADQKLSGLNCGAEEIIKWDGSTWVCASRTQIATSCETPGACRASCSEDKKVISGGCVFSGMRSCGEIENRPETDLSGWYCFADRADFGTWPCQVESAHAICQ